VTIVHRPLAELHQSDASCLAKLKWEHDNPQPSGHAAAVGNLCHASIERFTIEQAEHPGVDPRAVLRETVRSVRGDPEMTPDVIGDAVGLMLRAFAAQDRLWLGLPPSPWRVVPEWRWALDENFEPLSWDPDRNGWIKLTPARDPYGVAPAYAGTIDRLAFHPTVGKATVSDLKTIIKHESAEDIEGKKQPRWYSLAVLQHFPALREVEFLEINLRHLYTARAKFKRGEPWEEETRTRMRAAREARLAAIEKDEWPETPGVDCRFCPILFRCGQWTRLRAMGSVPEGTPTEQAELYLFAKAAMTRLKMAVEGIVAMTQEPIPLSSGESFGMKPGRGWVLARSYERTIAELEAMGMSVEQKDKWFRYVAEHHFPSRVLKALEELIGGKHARGLVDAGGWLDEVTEFEMTVWNAPAPKPQAPAATLEDFDAAIDRMFEGG
jgi:hypothetical protein